MAKIRDIVAASQDTAWTLTDNFEISISNKSIESPDDFGFKLPLCVVSIDLPPLDSAENEQVLGGERRIGVNLFELFKFSIKFRDYEGLKLRQFFETIWIAQQYEYFDNIVTSITLRVQDSKGKGSYLLFDTDQALITNIGTISFDNSSTSIAEFDVNFVAKSFSDNVIDDMGSELIYDQFADFNEKF